MQTPNGAYSRREPAGDSDGPTQMLARDGPRVMLHCPPGDGGEGNEDVVVQDAATGQDYYYVPRELHSVAGLVDQNGSWVEVYAYDAYGAAQIYDALGTPLTASAIGNPYFFTGRRLELLSNASLPRAYRQLYHYRARAYDPLHGRFAQRDPAEYTDGMNLYEYVRSRPVALLDPFGRIVEWRNISSLLDVYDEAATDLKDADNKWRAHWASKIKPFLAKWKFGDNTQEAVAQYTQNLYRAVYMARGFSPGGRVKESMNNRFVYTCKAGWIDIGHYSYSALGAYLGGKRASLWGGVQMEIIQSLWFHIESGLGIKLDGMALSAYTTEDLPSNLLGAKAGAHMLSKTVGFQYLIKGKWLRPGWDLLIGWEPYDLHEKLWEDIDALGPVNPWATLTDGPRKGLTPYKMLKFDAQWQEGRHHVNYSFEGQKSPLDYCMCKKDKPRQKKDRKPINPLKKPPPDMDIRVPREKPMPW